MILTAQSTNDYPKISLTVPADANHVSFERSSATAWPTIEFSTHLSDRTVSPASRDCIERISFDIVIVEFLYETEAQSVHST